MSSKKAQTCSSIEGHSESNFSKELDKFLPIANVSRIMKKSLPPNAKISKEAKETVQECVSEFISFVTGEASDKCQREKRKTINGDDLLWAMTTLGFEGYVGPLKIYLNKYREIEGDKSSVMARQEDQDDQDQDQDHDDHHNNSPANNNNNGNNDFQDFNAGASFYSFGGGNDGAIDKLSVRNAWDY